jgi:hypothetical protein
MVNTSANNVDTIVDDQPTLLLVQGPEMCKCIPQPQSPTPAQRPPIPNPPARQHTPNTHSLSGPKFFRLVTPQ